MRRAIAGVIEVVMRSSFSKWRIPRKQGRQEVFQGSIRGPEAGRRVDAANAPRTRVMANY
jgi:hypothetical protein